MYVGKDIHRFKAYDFAFYISSGGSGGAPPAHAPPTGPDSFVLTHTFFKT